MDIPSVTESGYHMKPMIFPAAFALLLALANVCPACPIALTRPDEGGWEARWNSPGVFHSHQHIWRFPHGGAPGADLADFPAPPRTGFPGRHGTDAEEPETDDGDHGVPPAIGYDRDARPDPASPIPAVPEPGSLALFGAGALGLLAARALLKDR